MKRNSFLPLKIKETMEKFLLFGDDDVVFGLHMSTKGVFSGKAHVADGAKRFYFLGAARKVKNAL